MKIILSGRGKTKKGLLHDMITDGDGNRQAKGGEERVEMPIRKEKEEMRRRA
ncbi:MAG TPA: hypothetical protein V6C82_08415 [Chroococcales cyanobacterium]|jgi:hypothetical protein